MTESDLKHTKLCCPLLVRRSLSLLSAPGSHDSSTDYTLRPVYSSFFINRSVCVCSLSTGRSPPDRWWRGRCSPAWRRAQWRKWPQCSSPLQLEPLKTTNVRRVTWWRSWRCVFVLRLSNSKLSTLGIVISSSSSSSSFSLWITVSS